MVGREIEGFLYILLDSQSIVEDQSMPRRLTLLLAR